ncbi:hypothetical protein [Streptomyces sp. SM11]|uniref:hypothetical protein n=1 Tax=Streptomyces sp. SM11 TaxID=565557 RepID=UPI0015E1A72D|nr:hypothetical protein [Streptomyces sp. SM11]
MSPDPLEERLSRLPRGWRAAPLERLPWVQDIRYGITRPGAHEDDGVGMVRASDIQEGRLLSEEPRRISPLTHKANARSEVRVGDVLIVLVGRVGETALVTEAHEGWNVARTVALVRTTGPDQAAWLRLWLRSSYVRAWCDRHVRGSTLQRTLNLKDLRGLPVPLPPAGAEAALLRTVKAAEGKMSVNRRIAECAMSLSDALFAVEARNRGAWPERSFGAVTHLRMGQVARPREGASSPTGVLPKDGVPFLAPADVLRKGLPYVSRTEAWLVSPDGDSVCAPQSLLLATREDGVHAVLNEVPVVPGRGVLALHTETLADTYWLLHEVRSRSRELTAAAQGPGGRELSRNALASSVLHWPPSSMRERFAQVVGRLHMRAREAHAENAVLSRLPDGLLDNFLDGAAVDEGGGSARRHSPWPTPGPPGACVPRSAYT